MIQKKICLIGAFAVGKTSLVKRFVKSIFDEKYLTTVGVKIDKKIVQVDDQQVMLVLWDMEGQDCFHNVKTSYVRGASGYLLVADGTRRETLDDAVDKLQAWVEAEVGKVPYLLLLNKSDLTDSWELDEDKVRSLHESGVIIMKTSAKTGAGVEEAFLDLATRMLEARKRGDKDPVTGTVS
jgi:small GTP-binding protein